ncbi:MAG: DUF1592 domain-containing protein [Prosthecobacter sp.]|uniref:DUF1592 domain-containing protein n=1 Tax=Prosthecobacter sp. TaxID=1965333 RepID=UPI0038FFDBFF
MQTYCIGCHGPKKQKGDFRVDELKIAANAADAENWQLVLDNLHLGEMPPEKEKQSQPAEVELVTTWIQSEIKRAAQALGGQKSEVVLRRLNRFEYENTIEDLFDVRGDYAIGFPEDATSGGFNNNGAALGLSAEQINQYLRAADFILNRAIVTKPKPETVKVSFTLHDIEAVNARRMAEREAYEKKNNIKRTEAELKQLERMKAAGGRAAPYYPKHGEDALIPMQYLKPDTNGFYFVREPGWYRYKVIAYPVRNDGAPMRLEVSHGTGRQEDVPTVVDIIQLTEAQPKESEFRVYLQPGRRIALRMIDGVNWMPGSKVAESTSPAIAIKKIEMEGPMIEQWPPRGHQAMFGKQEIANIDEAAVPQLLRDFAPKLFRRPVESSVVDEFVAFYQERLKEVSALDAFKLTVKAMMTSPLFLFHYEPATKVDDFALANRLSYFFWCSMPDDELLALAAKGSLANPAELKKQMTRLLADAKSQRFLQDFTGQWLQINKVGEMRPDKNLYPEYDDLLERAMVQETEMFIREMLINDLSLTNLIDSNWTMLNDRLAKHYGIAGVQGNEFRKVALDKTRTVRGGLLAQASILSITSNGTTTSPVVRGVWILNHLLGTPPPPPPPDVPPIEPDIRGASTIQEQLDKHRDIAQCAACHRKIDPYGIALENFDVIGGWRDTYRSLIQNGRSPRPQLSEGKAVSADDELPKLGRFATFMDFRTLLGKSEHLVFRNVAEQLATYALGRSLGFADREDIDHIVKTTRENGGGLKTMITALVQSPLFKRP